MENNEIKLAEESQLKPMREVDFSFMSENFYDIDKDFFLSYKPLSERLSCNFINYSSIKSDEDFLVKATKYITRTAFGLFGFITKETTPSVHLNLNSDQSYCGLTENKVQIGLKPLFNKNIERQTAVDIIVSDIYHEYYHKRYTNKDIGEINNVQLKDYYKNSKVQEYIKKLLKDETMKTILNILEDKRIEKLGSEDFPGYTFFFEEQRKYAAYLHKRAHQILTPPYELAIIQFLGIKILLPELLDDFYFNINQSISKIKNYYESPENLNEDGTKTINLEDIEEQETKLNQVLEVIKKIEDYIDASPRLVYSIFYSDIITAAKSIYDLIPKEILDEINAQTKSFIKISLDYLGDNDLEDFMEIPEELAKLIEDSISDEIKEMEKELKEQEGQKKNQKKDIKIEKIKVANNFCDYENFELITEPLVPIDYALLSDAKKIAKSIFNNLGFIDSKIQKNNEVYELTEGEIDEDELYSISFHSRDFFQDIEEIPSYSLDFGILLDESGSMSGRIREAKLAVLSMILALKDNKNINLFVNGHTANDRDYDRKNIQIFNYYNSLKNEKDWQRIFSAQSRSNNADGFAIKKMGEIMKASKSTDKILCVVSDGQPSASGYGGSQAENHVREVVNELEKDGITVIQICMAYIENSGKMFTNYIPFERDGVFFEKLKRILLTKLTQFSDSI